MVTNMEKQTSNNEIWEEIEQHGVPCKIELLCDYKKSYTGPGKEYVPLGSVENKKVHVYVEELKRDKDNVLWGRLRSGEGWIDLIDVEFCN